MALLAGLAACDKPQSKLFAEQTVAVVAPPASAEGVPHFVGRWAAADGQCATPWVFQARSLKGGDISCEFDKVDTSSAGYSVASTCKIQGKLQPVRLSIVLPDPNRVSSLTVSGGPFLDAVALQRCPA
jgi:hypothetical protein